jgi:hypothetical protein
VTEAASERRPVSRWLGAALLLGGIFLGQMVLYGESLTGSKLLLPLGNL